MRALIDTCVIIDVLQDREPFSADGRELFLYASNCLFTGCVTAGSATDIYYLTHRLTHDSGKAKEILGKLFSIFDLLDTTGNDCRLALLSPMSDYEDAVISETAVRCGIEYLVTRNVRDYDLSPVPVLTPGEFLDLIRKEND